MTLWVEKIFAIFLIYGFISSSLTDDRNQSLKVLPTRRVGILNIHDYSDNHKKSSKNKFSNDIKSSIEAGQRHDSSDSPMHEILSELHDLLPDRTIDDKYSYNPGGFYVPHEREAKFNYHFEEVTDSDESQNKGLVPDKESTKDSNSKILSGLNGTDTGIIKRPTFLSVFKKTILNPLVLISVAAVPLVFLIEMIFPYVSDIFISSMLPTFASTIVTGFARSLDGGKGIPIEEIMDAINDFGVRALEDSNCVQQFVCQVSKFQSENYSSSSWSIQKIAQKLKNSINDEFLEEYGLKALFNSVEKGFCGSLLCDGSPAYTQDAPLFEKLYLLSKKAFNLTRVII